ncbi:DNA modification methylase [Cetobacterium somerae]|uniref:DNA modification methylase n=1 Tax=Cetobacterium somerae TaxID=188913 RepID=UPI00211E184E|nr:DNA modification methylase [Cetobacterium somerae]MCQ9627503.1 DNA modification methylase [Cetobacterium somerae]
MEKIKIENIKISPGSPIVNTPEQIEIYKKLNQESIKMIPVVVDDKNEIILGEAKYLALKELGEKEIEIYRMKDLTPEQIKLLRIAETKGIQLGEWDSEKLLRELEEIGEFAELSGFDMETIQKELSEYGDPLDKTEEIPIPELEEVFFSRPGDMYILGKHKLLCGDSTSPEDVKRLFGDEKMNLLLTDPPYNIDYESGNGLKIKNDNMGEEEFYNFLLKFYKNAFDFMEEGAAFYIFYGDIESENFRKTLKEARFKLSQCLIWVKDAFNLSRQDYNWKHEPVLYGWKPGASHFFIKDYTQDTVLEESPNYKKFSKNELIEHIYQLKKIMEESSSIIREDKPRKNENHPTPKPIKLIARLMANSSKRGWIVGDMFGGSGSTLITAEQLEREARLMEYDPRYVDVIVKRYMSLGKTDIKLIRNETEIGYEQIVEFLGD